jgi:Ca2+-binding RTX toxin-like protein
MRRRRQRTRRLRQAAGIAAAIGAALGGPATAGATITPTRDATAVAAAIATDATGVITGAQFSPIPPNGNPAAVADSELARFPLDGPSYGILSTGDAAAAANANDSTSTSNDNDGDNAGHGQVQDVVTLRLDVTVPPGANCLTFDFRLLSEEFPEYVGSQFNDGFVGELDNSSFRVAGPGNVTAEDNFAIDENGKPPTVNTTGTSADNALGTTYDGATPILRATTQVVPGAHTLYLSAYDASDAVYDTSVFVDNLRLYNAPPTQCVKGATPTPSEGGQCQGKPATVIASDGVATGTPQADVILGSKDSDLIRGRGGDDTICGRGGKDEIKGGQGEDRIQGNNGRDEVSGRAGDDELIGGKRSDVLRGNSGADLLRGSSGDDELFGGPDEDECHGGAGEDSLHSCAG